MLPTIHDQVFTTTKTDWEAELTLWTGLSNKAIENLAKIASLNLTALKGALDESTLARQQLLSANGPGEFFSASVAQAQPNLENALSYGRQVAGIASDMQAVLIETAQEKITETNHKVAKLIDDIASNAPDGSKHVIGTIKSAIDSAHASYEQFVTTAKQANETWQANLGAASDGFAQSVGKATRHAKK